ncbi:hypothetical protein HDV05_007682 [Chytridiales sp. JEL 0842]|nr:hypothetical protein HDV05_007682 [Chytridiales sp. JEL 0842]
MALNELLGHKRPRMPPDLAPIQHTELIDCLRASWTEEQRADLAYELLSSLETPLLSNVVNRLVPLLYRDFVADLPYELSIHILGYLDAPTLTRASLISKKWNAMAQDNYLWRSAFKRNGWSVNEKYLDEWSKQSIQRPLDLSPTEQRDHLRRNWEEGRYTTSEILGHTEAIYALQFDNEKIVSCSRDQSIKIWDIATGECRKVLTGHQASVLCVQFDEHFIVSGSSDFSIIVWDIRTGNQLKTLRAHSDSVLNLRFNNMYIVSCSKDKLVKVWSLETGECLRTLRGHRAAVNAVAVRQDSKIIVSASGDRTIKVWDLESGNLLRTLIGHNRGVACVDLHGHIIVSGSSDQTVKVWDSLTGAILHTLTGHNELVRTVQCNSQYIISGSYDTTIKVWDLKTGKLLLNLVDGGHTDRVFKVQFNATKIKIVVWDFALGVDAKLF